MNAEIVTPAALGLALLIGGVMGLLGGGGSILAVPAFTFILGLPPKQAVVASLVVVGVAAASGAARGLIRRVIPPGVSLVVGGSAMIGSIAGSLIGTTLTDHTQLRILAIVMVAAAAVIWRQREQAVAPVARPSRGLLAGIGLATGLLTGVAGVGGGFLIVPALVVAAGLSMQQAAAASMFVIAVAAASALSGYVASVGPEWSMLMPLAVVASVATLAGARIASRLPQLALQRSFAVSLVVIGSWMWTRA